MRTIIKRLRQRLAAWADPELEADLRSSVRRNATLEARLRGANLRATNCEDALLRINENARNGALPEAKFLQVDYGRGGVSRETVITGDALKHPRSGLNFVADGDRVVVQDSLKRPLFTLTQERLTWPNGLYATIGSKVV